MLAFVLASAGVRAQEADPAGAGPYSVSVFQLQFIRPLPFLPAPQTISDSLNVPLVRDGNAIVFPEPGSGAERVPLGLLTVDGPVIIGRPAVVAIAEEIQSFLANQGFICTVLPSIEDIDPATGADLRRGQSGPLAFQISFEGDQAFEVDEFRINYANDVTDDTPDAPDLLASARVRLYPDDENDRWVAWNPSVDPVEFALDEAALVDRTRYSAGALQSVIEAVRDEMLRRELMSVIVVPGEGQLANDLSDLRADQTFVLDIIIGTVGDVRTLGVGKRVPSEERVNHPKHAEIREQSPFNPGDQLNKGVLDDFLFFKSRHPGRRVDAAIAPSDEPMSVTLDYIVTENRPFQLYFQASNTGTESVGDFRYRAGFFHNQLTGNDDILTAEYSNVDTDEDNNTVVASYDAKFFGLDRLRWRVYGGWSEYLASDLGINAESDAFDGNSWTLGGELRWNYFQHRELFLDVMGGMRYTDIEANNNIGGFSGEQDFLVPYIGLGLERFTQTENSSVTLTFEITLPDATNVQQEEIDLLGRTDVDKQMEMLRWDASHSFFLEPILNRVAWRDVSTPESSTLAHEMALRFRGLYGFDNRLIPQFQQVAGGLYTVRGYEEAEIAGDTVLLGTVEYRLHIPQLFGIQVNPATFMGQPFRVVPQHPYGRADWDLIFKGFLDVGYVEVNDPQPFEEEDQTLLGTGVGLQLLLRTNLDVRVEWGIALEDVEGGSDSGDSRVHFVATLLF